MKTRVFSLAACLLSLAAYADKAAILPTKPDSIQAGVHLDQAKDVFFDQFFPYSSSLQVLQTKNLFNKYDFIIGGSLQTDWQYWYGHNIDTVPPSFYKNGRGLYFTQVLLDLMTNVGPWLTTFLSIADAHVGQPAPDGNDVFLNRAFIIIGNLDKFPIYTTAGINAIPFGIFLGTGVWDLPLTSAYFNPIQAPQLSVGFFKAGLNMNAALYSDEANHQNHRVLSVYYNKANGNFHYSLGAGYLTQLQINATGTTATRRKHKRAIPPGLYLGDVTDLNASVGYGALSLSGEYDQGSENVGTNTSMPQALALMLMYTHNLAGRDATVTLSASRSFHLKSIPTSLAGADYLPLSSDGFKNAWALSVSRPFFSKAISLGVDFEKTETYLAAKSYTGTVELFLYL